VIVSLSEVAILMGQMVALHALCCGKPVIIAEMSNIRAYFESLEVVALLALRDADAMVSAIERFRSVQDRKKLPVQAIAVLGNVPDLRPEILRCQIAVFLFINGAGIKNKVLESAALGMPTILSRRATNGLLCHREAPFSIARRPRQWADELDRLWVSDTERKRVGTVLREWVTNHHSWGATAERAIGSLNTGIRAES